MFESGINWGRVVTLLGFGYRMAIHVYQQGIPGFLCRIARYIADFMLQNRIAQWIAQQGGWVSLRVSGGLGMGALPRRLGSPGCSSLAQAALTHSGYSLFLVRWLHSIWTMFT